MLHIRISDEAENDLEKIGEYTEAPWGALKRNEYLDSVACCIEKPAGNPHIGTLRPELGRDLYSLPHESHLIFYRFDDMVIEIGKILHSRMDVALHLGGNPQ